MKKIFYAMFAAALMLSCSEATVDEGVTPPQSVTSNPIEFYADGGADSRTTYFEGDNGMGVHWEANDKLSVIVRGWYDKSGVNTETRNRGYYVANAAGASVGFDYASSDQLAWDFTLRNTGKKITEQDVDFVSFYCNPSSSSTTIYSGITVNSDYQQVQSAAGSHAHIGDYMVMVSDIVQREAGNTAPISFKFQNLMSVVELTLKSSLAKEVASIDLISTADYLAFTKAALCVEDWTTTTDVVEVPGTLYPVEGESSQSVSLTITEPAALSAEGAKFYMVVWPGKHQKGDITLKVNYTDGSATIQEMGAVTFEKGKVYRPEVTLYEVNASADNVAEIELSGNDIAQVFGSVNFENGAYIINSRTTMNGNGTNMALYNVPEKFCYSTTTPWQTLSVMHGLHLDVDVTVKTSGYLYVLVDSQKATYYNDLLDDGWRKETAYYANEATDTQLAGFVEGTWDDDFPIFYATGISESALSNSGYFVIFSRYYEAGSVVNLKSLVSTVAFRGIRVVAKSISWPIAQAEIQQTEALSDGELYTFEEGVALAPTTGVIAPANSKGEVKSVPAGYVGMKFFSVKRGTTAVPNCRTVTAKVTKSGMLYQIVPKNAQNLLRPSGKDVADGWRCVEWFYLNKTTVNPFYISAQWVEAGTEVTTYDYTEKVAETANSVGFFNTGIFMGDLTVKEVTE